MKFYTLSFSILFGFIQPLFTVPRSLGSTSGQIKTLKIAVNKERGNNIKNEKKCASFVFFYELLVIRIKPCSSV